MSSTVLQVLQAFPTARLVHVLFSGWEKRRSATALYNAKQSTINFNPSLPHIFLLFCIVGPSSETSPN